MVETDEGKLWGHGIEREEEKEEVGGRGGNGENRTAGG